MNIEKTLLHITTGFAALALLGLGAPDSARAQAYADSPRWTVDGRGGISVPVSDLSDLPIDDVAPTAGVGVGYHLTSRVTLRVDGNVEWFSGEEMAAGGSGPDITLWHYNGGVEVELTEPGAGPWDVSANLAGGATTWDTDTFTTGGGGTAEVSETYFTANGGLRAGYDISERVHVFVGGQWYLQFTDEAETRPLAALSPELNEGLDTASSLPLTAGIELKI